MKVKLRLKRLFTSFFTQKYSMIEEAYKSEGLKENMPESKSMSYTKIFLLISLFLLILTSFRIGWIMYHTPTDHPAVKEGFVDLSDWSFSDTEAITLQGEWEFY